MKFAQNIANGIEKFSTEQGNKAMQKAVNKISLDASEEVVQQATIKAAEHGAFVYDAVKKGIYGAAIGGTVGLIGNVGDGNAGETIKGTGLGALGGASIGGVAAAIAKGMR